MPNDNDVKIDYVGCIFIHFGPNNNTKLMVIKNANIIYIGCAILDALTLSSCR